MAFVKEDDPLGRIIAYVMDKSVHIDRKESLNVLIYLVRVMNH